MNSKHKTSIIIILFIILVLISLFVGNLEMNLSGLFTFDEEHLEVLIYSRIPRTVSVILVGVGLSVSGLVLQKLFQNKFVSPTTSGVEDGAKLGYIIGLVFFSELSSIAQTFMTFIFSFVSAILFMKIIDSLKFKNVIYVPIIGIMLGTIISAFSTIIAYQNNLLQNMSSFLLGNFATVTKGNYEGIYFIIPIVIILYIYANRLNIASMGSDFAHSVGMNYKSIFYLGIILVSLTNSIIIVTIGSVSFLGLIVPNIVRMFYGDNMKRNLPLTALYGAFILLICDIFSRLIIHPYEIPVGLVLGVLGGVIFLGLIIKETNEQI